MTLHRPIPTGTRFASIDEAIRAAHGKPWRWGYYVFAGGAVLWMRDHSVVFLGESPYDSFDALPLTCFGHDQRKITFEEWCQQALGNPIGERKPQ